jgi:hypothetical protein
MDFAALAQHAAIGWDIDGTLVDNPAAPALYRFIAAHPEKQHCLVTFRTHGLLRSIERDLARSGCKDMSIFDTLLSVPEDMWLQWALQTQRRKDGLLSGKLLLAETVYMEWKGFICRQNGLTALVDDDRVNVERGCRRYGIVLFDATTAVP